MMRWLALLCKFLSQCNQPGPIHADNGNDADDDGNDADDDRNDAADDVNDVQTRSKITMEI